MNRAARRYLLGIVSDCPLFVATVPDRPSVAAALEAFLESTLHVMEFFILPADATLSFARCARVRVVAGKGRRRRGVRT